MLAVKAVTLRWAGPALALRLPVVPKRDRRSHERARESLVWKVLGEAGEAGTGRTALSGPPSPAGGFLGQALPPPRWDVFRGV